jgi:hypothetical protein
MGLANDVAAQDNEGGKVNFIGKATLLGKNRGEISRKDLLDSKGILPEKHLLDSGYKVVSFRLTIVKYDGDPMEVMENKESGLFTDEMINEIKGAKDGSRLYFEFVECSLGSGARKNLHPAAFILK